MAIAVPFFAAPAVVARSIVAYAPYSNRDISGLSPAMQANVVKLMSTSVNPTWLQRLAADLSSTGFTVAARRVDEIAKLFVPYEGRTDVVLYAGDVDTLPIGSITTPAFVPTQRSVTRALGYERNPATLRAFGKLLRDQGHFFAAERIYAVANALDPTGILPMGPSVLRERGAIVSGPSAYPAVKMEMPPAGVLLYATIPGKQWVYRAKLGDNAAIIIGNVFGAGLPSPASAETELSLANPYKFLLGTAPLIEGDEILLPLRWNPWISEEGYLAHSPRPFPSRMITATRSWSPLFRATPTPTPSPTPSPSPSGPSPTFSPTLSTGAFSMNASGAMTGQTMADETSMDEHPLLTIDLSPAVKVVARPYRADGKLMLAMHADTKFGPMDLTASMDEVTYQKLKAEGKARFAPRIKAWLDKMLTMHGMTGLPGETEDGSPLPSNGNSGVYGAGGYGLGATAAGCWGGYCTLPVTVYRVPWWWQRRQQWWGRPRMWGRRGWGW